jgi:divalent metal cation (Fe/Co/Zn/Cd) transporter
MTAVANHRRLALWLSGFTVGYNVLEGLISIMAGAWAGSTALIGFGLDSFIESLSGSIMIWRFWKHRENEGEAESKAMRLVAYTFVVLGLYVLFDSGKSLYLRERPVGSLLGIIVAVVSLVVMPGLFLVKYRLGKRILSGSLVADSKQTLACAMLSVALLLGLTLNYVWGFWWADSIAGVVIAVFLIREGRETFREGRACC